MRTFSRRRTRWVFFSMLALGTLLVALLPVGAPLHRGTVQLRTLSRDLLSPLLRVFAFVGDFFGDLADSAGALTTAGADRAELESRAVELEAQVARIAARADHLQKQLAALTSPGGAAPEGTPRTLAEVIRKVDVFPALHVYRAPVTAHDAALWPRSVIVNRGSRHGLKTNMPAVWAGALAGITTSVGGLTSQVRLLTDPNSRVWVLDARDRDIEGIVEGTGSKLLNLVWVPMTDSLRVGDPIITTGFSGAYAPRLLVGKVVSVEEAPDGHHWQAKVAPACDFRRLRSLLLVDMELPEDN